MGKIEAPLFLQEVKEGVLVHIHVQPKSSRTKVSGIFGTSLKLQVQAPPVDGAANKACQKFLAKLIGLSKSDVMLKSGAKSREKVFLLKGVNLQDVSPLFVSLI